MIKNQTDHIIFHQFLHWIFNWIYIELDIYNWIFIIIEINTFILMLLNNFSNV